MKKMLRLVVFVLLVLLFWINISHAVGGSGAACAPTLPGWGSCQLEAVPFAGSVTNTVNVPGGNWTSPYEITASNTRYVLQGNVTANSTGFLVNASYIIIDLNGFTLTYNQISPGEGVRTGSSGRSRVAVINGSIIQGAAKSEGTSAGIGNNAVGDWEPPSTSRTVNYGFLSNLYIEIGGRDVSAIFTQWGTDWTIKETVIKDTYVYGTLKNRHHGIGAIKNNRGNNALIEKNTIIGWRHWGITVERNSTVRGNHITINSLDTNSYGIWAYAGQNNTFQSNTVIGSGVHPIGIGVISNGSNGFDISDNLIKLQVTKIATEYGDSMSAAGFRTTWGGNNINFYKNEIYITTAASHTGTYAHNGQSVMHQSRGKGLFIGANAGETAYFVENYIELTGDGEAKGITPAYADAESFYVIGNTIVSPHIHVELLDDYSRFTNYPLFALNNFVRTGNRADYRTVQMAAQGGSGWGGDVRVRFVGNTYTGGASINSISLRGDGPYDVNVYFGSLSGGGVTYDHRHYKSGASILRQNYTDPVTLTYAYPVNWNITAPESGSGSPVAEPSPVVMPPPSLSIISQ